jgi:hypothetical protein
MDDVMEKYMEAWQRDVKLHMRGNMWMHCLTMAN